MPKKIRIKKCLCTILIMLFVTTSFYPIISKATDITKNEVENEIQTTTLPEINQEQIEVKNTPIDITNDLEINVVETVVKTKTNDGIYDADGRAGMYLPGKDFSKNDDVSKGNNIVYTIGIALSSKTNSEYGIDKMYIEVVNEIGNKISPYYYINTDPNSENLVPDGNNTLVTNQTAISSSVTLGANDGITSTSTTSLDLNFNVQNCYWKTKLMPKIRIVCQKDGQKQVSNDINLTPIKMSSKAKIITTLNGDNYAWSKNNYQTINEKKGFLLQFQINQTKQRYTNMISSLNSPIYSEVEYSVGINSSIEGTTIPINSENISIQNQNKEYYEVLSYKMENGVLKIKLLQKKQNTPELPSFLVSVFLPYDKGDKKEVTVSMNSQFTDTIRQTNFVNQNLFDASQDGILDRTVKISFENPIPPVETLKMREELFAGIGYNTTASNSVIIQDTDIIQTKGSKFVMLLDSQIVSFSKDTSMATQQNNTREVILPSDYTVSYANVSYDFGYNPNTIGKNIIEGIIPISTYEEVTSGGKKANAIIFTLTKDIVTGPDFKNFKITAYNEKLTQISNKEFIQMYQNNPEKDFTGYAYSYTSLNTKLTSIEEANTQYANLLSSQDNFMDKEGSIYLNWGTTKVPTLENINRFNDNSIVRKNMEIPVINQPFDFGVYDKNNNKANIIEDYSKEYNLLLTRNENDYTGTNTFIKKGTKISFSMNDDLMKNMYISNIPYLEIFDITNSTYTKIDIQEYNHDDKKIIITIPFDLTMTKQDRIVIPTSFIVPYYEKDLTSSISFSDEIYLISNSFLNGISNTTQYYKTTYQSFNTKLMGVQTDSTGLEVTPNKYQNGSDVKYITKVLNKSFELSDYYIGMTSPTNEYSSVETSNNNLNAYIKDIFLYDSNVELYYQTEDKVTTEDKTVLKTINQQPTLNSYYNSVVKNNWTKYDNTTLPNNVVLLLAFAKDVKKGELIRIDYDVNIAIEKEDINIYTNNNAITYYSTGSTLETRSNQVTVQNIPSIGIVNVKYLEEDTNKELEVSENLTGAVGTIYETANKNIEGYTLTKIPDNSKGEFLETPQEVIYYYIKNPIINGIVNVKHLEEDTNKELEVSENLTGAVGTIYETANKNIEGYTLTKIPDNSKGEFLETSQEVIYYYIKNPNTGCVFDIYILILLLIILIIVAIILCVLLHCCKKRKLKDPDCKL